MRAPPRPPNQATTPPGEDAGRTTLSGSGGLRKKGGGVRPWLSVDSSGQAQTFEVGKHAIMARTGLPARDLRILDPLLSYPSSVLGRERAIVINIEHIKAIITAQEVLMLKSNKDPSVSPFIEELQRRILRHHYKPTSSQETGADGENTDGTNLSGSDNTQSKEEEEGKVEGEQQVLKNKEGMKPIPFEFVALEACLDAACSNLDHEARAVEEEAHPALDKLTTKISTHNLERVRQIKNRLVAITGRVQKVKDELEHLLDDDNDMAEMYLTNKLQQELENFSMSSASEPYDWDDHINQAEMDDRVDAEISAGGVGGSTRLEDHINGGLSETSDWTHTSTTDCLTTKVDVEDLEMLLEAYFVLIGGTLSKLFALKEYVDDTEDYINIMLDDKQNHLLQMGVMLSTATLVISAFVTVSGIFGMNIQIDMFDGKKSGMKEFWWTVGGGAAGTIFLYVVVIGWCKHKHILA